MPKPPPGRKRGRGAVDAAEGGAEAEDEVRTAAEIAADRAARMTASDDTAASAEETAAAEAAPADEAGEPTTEAQPEEAAAEGEAAEPEAGAETPITTAVLLRGTLDLLGLQAWQELGLQVAPRTGQLHTDLEQARLAIDAYAAILEKLQPHLTPDERQQCDTILANLRLNYVQRSS